jgi:hypothetical protein
MAGHPFRTEAREALERAKARLQGPCELQDIRYAALDVRLAMEALTYARAQAYRKQLPSAAYATWAPKKLMSVLLSLDPWAEGGIKVEIAKGGIGTPLENEFFSLGTDTGVSLKLLREHYDAVGNMLHSPTMAQREGKKPPTAARFRKRLEEVIAYLEAVLASPIFDLNTLALHPHRACERCDYRIREPELDAENRAEATCPECRLTYDLVRHVKGHMIWQAKRVALKCMNLACPAELRPYKADLKHGMSLTCETCSEETLLVYGSRRPPEDGEAGPTFQVKGT